MRDQRWHQDHRREIANNFNMHYRKRVALLDPDQTTPPTSDAMIFPERHFMSSLFLYHHGNGHEFADVGVDYAELDQRAHNWLNEKDFNAENLILLRDELNAIIDNGNRVPMLETQTQPALSPPISPAEAKIILRIIDKIASLEQRPSSAIDAVSRFNSTMDPNQLLLACASCGERHAVKFDKDRYEAYT